jgi:hypothetical protein
MTIKKLTIFLIFFISFLGMAQEAISKDYLFIRVYNLEGKKIGNDILVNVNDTTVSLEVKGSILTIPVSEIGEIRTKHSLAGNLIIGSIFGTSLALALLAADPETGTPSNFTGPERVVAVVGGLIIGTVAGLATGIFRKSETYKINGDPDALKKFKETVQASLPD